MDTCFGLFTLMGICCGRQQEVVDNPKKKSSQTPSTLLQPPTNANSHGKSSPVNIQYQSKRDQHDDQHQLSKFRSDHRQPQISEEHVDIEVNQAVIASLESFELEDKIRRRKTLKEIEMQVFQII